MTNQQLILNTNIYSPGAAVTVNRLDGASVTGELLAIHGGLIELGVDGDAHIVIPATNIKSIVKGGTIE